MKNGTVVFWWSWNEIKGRPIMGVVVSTDDSSDVTRHSASGLVQVLGQPVQYTIVKNGGDDEQHWFALTPGTKRYDDQLFIAPKRDEEVEDG